MIRCELSGNFDESVGTMYLIAKFSCLVSSNNGFKIGCGDLGGLLMGYSQVDETPSRTVVEDNCKCVSKFWVDLFWVAVMAF